MARNNKLAEMLGMTEAPQQIEQFECNDCRTMRFEDTAYDLMDDGVTVEDIPVIETAKGKFLIDPYNGEIQYYPFGSDFVKVESMSSLDDILRESMLGCSAVDFFKLLEEHDKANISIEEVKYFGNDILINSLLEMTNPHSGYFEEVETVEVYLGEEFMVEVFPYQDVVRTQEYGSDTFIYHNLTTFLDVASEVV